MNTDFATIASMFHNNAQALDKAIHESIHVGQMTYLRKRLGYEPVFG